MERRKSEEMLRRNGEMIEKGRKVNEKRIRKGNVCIGKPLDVRSGRKEGQEGRTRRIRIRT